MAVSHLAYMVKSASVVLTGQLSRIRIHSLPLPYLPCTSPFSSVPDAGVMQGFAEISAVTFLAFEAWIPDRDHKEGQPFLPLYPPQFLLHYFLWENPLVITLWMSVLWIFWPIKVVIWETKYSFTVNLTLKRLAAQSIMPPKSTRINIFSKWVDTSQMFCSCVSTFYVVKR